MLLALVASAAAVWSPGPADGAAAQEGGEALEGRFFEPVFDEMTVTEDIIYGEAMFSSGELKPLHLDVYEPAGDVAETRPVIVLLHGGFFAIGNHKNDNYGAGPNTAKTFTDLGYVVAAVEYRQRPELPLIPPLQAPPEVLALFEEATLDAHDDVAAAIGWLRDHAADFRVDSDAVVPYGFSAGGVIAWNMAWLPGSSARPDPVGVPAAVSVVGVPYETSTITGEPLAAPTPGDAPVIDFHGTADQILDYSLAAEPCGRAAAVGVRCELVSYEGIGHPLDASDTSFVPRYQADAHLALEFIGEEVLVPLGYIDEVPPPEQPPPTPPVTPPSTGETPPSSPGGEPPRATPVARPARPVVADPTYTG